MEDTFTVGTVVKMTVDNLLNTKKEMLGVAVEEYGAKGTSLYGSMILFANGNYDGFSLQEQIDFLEKVGVCTVPRILDYQFQNVMQLSKDYDNGKFHSVFLNGEFERVETT